MNTKILLAGVSAIAIAAAASSANAASHKVAEQIDALSKKVEGMSDSFAKKGVKGASLTISGQVNRAVLIRDDANGTFISNADNNASSTRVRWVASAPMNNGMKAGAMIETSIQTQSTTGTVNNNGGAGGATTFGTRHIDAWVAGGFGKLSTGQGSVATDGILHANFMHAGLADINGEPTLGGVITFGDGAREDRVRYDTPSFGGAKMAISYGNQGHVAVAATYAGTFDNVKVAARIGWEDHSNGGADISRVSGSAGVNVSGFQATIIAANQESDAAAGDDAMYGLQLGYTGKLTSMGNTGFAVQYVQRANTEKSYAIGVTQDLAPGTTAYAAWRRFDRADVNAGMIGMRVKF